jgi:hypothetical protein
MLRYSTPVATRAKTWVCCRSLAGIMGSNAAGSWMFVSCDFSVLSGRDICVGLIIRPQIPTECVVFTEV